MRTAKAILFASAFCALSPIFGGAALAQRAATAASSPTGLAEVVVTAQRRGENLQDVPIAVNALTAEQLRAMGGTSSENLAMVPAVVYNPGVGGGQISIRGITGSNSGADEPGNAIYIDGVYQFSPTASLFQFNAIERIEILKGPQGTLFGRNTAGGVVQVITRDPGREPAGEAQVGYGNYRTTSGNLYLSTPLTDTLAVNLAAYGFDQSEGWGKNVFTGRDVHKGYSWGVRGKLKWVAADGKTDVLLVASYNKDRPLATDSGNIPAGILDLLGRPTTGIYNTNSELNTHQWIEQHAFAGTIHHDLGFARLTSITAYSKMTADSFLDGDATPLPGLVADLAGGWKNFTQEIQVQSPEGSKLQWIAGAFYLQGKQPGLISFGFFGGPPVVIPSNIDTRSYAAFGQATYPITEATRITAGLRYTSDKHTITSPGVDKSRTDAKVTWRLAVDHKFSEDILGYASYSRGFKGGVFNPTDPSHVGSLPTTLDAYEVGLKTEAFDHRLRVNGAVFYYDYQDVQVQLFNPVTGGAYQSNAGPARTYGLDLDVAVEPVQNLTLTGGLALLDTKFTSSTLAPCFTVPPAPAPGVIVGSCSVRGNRLAFAPEVTATLAANYRYETAIGSFDLAGAYHHSSSYFPDPSNFGPSRTKAFDTVNASVTWNSPTSKLNASLWGKNLLDEHRIGSADTGAGLAGVIAYPLAPRTYGVTLGVKF